MYALAVSHNYNAQHYVYHHINISDVRLIVVALHIYIYMFLFHFGKRGKCLDLGSLDKLSDKRQHKWCLGEQMF